MMVGELTLDLAAAGVADRQPGRQGRGDRLDVRRRRRVDRALGRGRDRVSPLGAAAAGLRLLEAGYRLSADKDVLGPKGRTVKVVFLNGVQAPLMEMRQPGFTIEGMEYVVSIDAGAYAMDYRAMYRNEGD